MKEDEYFDIFFEGTSLKRSMDIKSVKCKVLVIDKQDTYGTTINVKDFNKSRHIRNLVIKKVAKDKEFFFESMPAILKNTISNTSIIEFVDINNHFYYNEYLVKFVIPYNITQVVDSKFMSLLDKRYFIKLIKKDISFKEAFENFSSEFTKIIKNTYSKNTDQNEVCTLKEYIENFGKSPFIYPKNGYREISEIISRFNALKGIGYYLDSGINVEEIEGDEYHFLIKSIYGNIYSKEYSRDKIENFCYFRILAVKDIFIESIFFAVFDLPKKIWCMGLDDSTSLCAKKCYVLYFWKHESEISDADLEKLGLKVETVILDISFESSNETFINLNSFN